MSDRKKLLGMIRFKGYRTGHFKLASGQTSTEYLDLKPTLLDPHALDLCVECVRETLASAMLYPDMRAEDIGVSGPGFGGLPLAVAFSLAMARRCRYWPVVLVRPEVKDHGTGSKLEGTSNLPAGSRIIVLEDVVTSGGSSVRAIQSLREAGLHPFVVVSMVDREAGGRAAIEAAEARFLSVFTFNEVRAA